MIVTFTYLATMITSGSRLLSHRRLSEGGRDQGG
jgi:hypothetical protein